MGDKEKAAESRGVTLQSKTFHWAAAHPVLKREDRLRKHPFAGFGMVMEDIKRSAYTK